MQNDSRWLARVACVFVLGAACSEAPPPENPPSQNPPSNEVCDNQLDDDADGRADCDDPDCAGEPSCAPPEERCDNQADDDEDGQADCDDPDCAGEPPCAQPDELCDNQADDDEDGQADCDDTDCASEPLCAAPPVEVCDNEVDDDGDGNADCDDDACASEPLCAPAPVESCDNGLDDDGDGAKDCDDPDCAGLDPCVQVADPGDVVIVEIMIDPASVADAAGEWIELLNTTDRDIDISGWVLHDIDQTAPQWHVIGGHGPVVLAAGGTLVLGARADATSNGGVAVDYEWATFGLANDAGEIVLEVKGEQIDVVTYAAPTWPVSQGHSLSLDPVDQTATANDDPLAWCLGTIAYNSVDHGTPGAANPSCP